MELARLARALSLMGLTGIGIKFRALLGGGGGGGGGATT